MKFKGVESKRIEKKLTNVPRPFVEEVCYELYTQPRFASAHFFLYRLAKQRRKIERDGRSPPRGRFSTSELQMYKYQPHLRILVVVCRCFSFRFVSRALLRIRGKNPCVVTLPWK